MKTRCIDNLQMARQMLGEFYEGTLSPQETRTLARWLNQQRNMLPPQWQAEADLLNTLVASGPTEELQMPSEAEKKLLDRIAHAQRQATAVTDKQPRRRMLMRRFATVGGFVAAACVGLIVILNIDNSSSSGQITGPKNYAETPVNEQAGSYLQTAQKQVSLVVSKATSVTEMTPEAGKEIALEAVNALKTSIHSAQKTISSATSDLNK